MHDDLKRRLREEVDAELGTRPPRNLPDALTRGRRKRLALRLVTTMSMVIVGTVLVAGGLSIGRALSSDEALPPANPDSDATVVDFPALTNTFVSPTNGFSIKHPDGATLTPATTDWGGGNESPNEGFDVVETGLAAIFRGSSTQILSEVPTDEWVEELSEGWPGGCGEPRSQQEEITIDGQSGRISECPNRVEATVVVDGRLYLFTLTHERDDARAVFDTFVATIDLTPETAVFLPAMPSTFVSPTYGYSFKYLDRGGLAPATKRWDPINQPLDKNINDQDDRFDAVETGLGAYFEGASTPIADGVSIDEWVDEHVTPLAADGCGVPRSQQEKITIDGQSGKVADCPSQIEATVVLDGRLYLFRMSHSGPILEEASDSRTWFDAWIATIDLTPETAAEP